MSRPSIAPGEHGQIAYHALPDGRVRATTRYRHVVREDGRPAVDGNQVVTVQAFGADQTEALMRLSRKIANLADPDRAERARKAPLKRLTAFADVTQAWWTLRLVDGRPLRPSSLDKYQAVLENQVLPALGNTPIGKVTTDKLNELLASILAATPGNFRQARTVIRQISQYARDFGYVEVNPARELRQFTVPDHGEEPITLTAEELARLRSAAALYRLSQPRVRIPIDLIIDVAIGAGGLRLGETLALDWTDHTVDRNAERYLHIRRTIIKGRAIDLGGSTVVQDATKNGHERIVHLAAVAADALDRLESGTGLIFATRNGTPISETNFSRVWTATRTIAKLPEIVTFQAIRRTIATAAEADYGLAIAANVLGDRSRAVVNKHYIKRALQVPDVRSSIEALLQRPD